MSASGISMQEIVDLTDGLCAAGALTVSWQATDAVVLEEET